MKPSIYQVFPRVELPDRLWPNNQIKEAPAWCSIDLSAGNQALPKPMSLENKVLLFSMLVSIGFKQIEVGIPGRSEEDFLFVRTLIQEKLIPEDVTIQVLSQLKESMIDKTLSAIDGCNKVIINLFQSTSALRREAIFDMCSQNLLEHTVAKVSYAKTKAKQQLVNTEYQFSFSIEGFNTTEPSLLLELCQAVIDGVAPTPNQPMILSLVAALETDLANYFADQVEYVARALKDKTSVILSVQAHNDRGSAVASSELALLAGASRIEGSLLGHGERAGVCCLLTLALNLYGQGIAPQLELSNLNQIVSVIEHCTEISCDPRHPYAGDLVFAAFSAPQQFAIQKAYQAYMDSQKKEWHVPYLPIDPNDIGRGNDDVIRLNALSGRTGITYVMKKNHGYQLPLGMQNEFSELIKGKAQDTGTELSSEQVWEYFAEYYFKGKKSFELNSISFEKQSSNGLCCQGEVLYQGKSYQLTGQGSGALDTVIAGIKQCFDWSFDVIDYHQHALGKGSIATAVSYLQIIDVDGNAFWGVGVDSDTTLATLDALSCALNKKLENKNG